MLAAFLTTVLFSISAVSGNRTSRLLGGTDANFWRLCFGALLLALYAHSFGGALAGSAFPVFLVSGCIGFGIGDMALFQALPRIGSRLSVLLTLCLSSPIAALMEWGWMGTRLTLMEIGCGLVTLAGVALALAPNRQMTISRQQFWGGVAFGSVAAFCQGYGAVLSRKAFNVARDNAEAIDGITAAYQRILGGVILTGIFLLIVKRNVIGAALSQPANPIRRNTPWREAWPWVLVNGLAGPALGVSCYQWALKSTPTGVVLPIVALTPIVIIPFSRYLERERPTRRSLAGGAVAVLGAVLLTLTHRPK